MEVVAESSVSEESKIDESGNSETEPILNVGTKRPAGEDESTDARKRIRGPPPDMTEKLEEEMATLGDNQNVNIVEALRNLCQTLLDCLQEQEFLILQVFARWLVVFVKDENESFFSIKFKPEKLTIYSTLAGLVNAKDPNFGPALLNCVITELETSIQKEEFDIALRIITFASDLANTKVVSISSLFAFLNRFVEFADHENLQTDYFVFMVLHTLPWVGMLLSTQDKDSLIELLNKLSNYISGRQKLHLKALQVWTGKLEQDQDDYIDSLWAQIRDLDSRQWNEQHILRVDMAFTTELSESTRHDIPEIILPEFSDSVNYPLPRIVFRLFTPSDVIDSDVSLPEATSIERFLVEEDLNWIISNNYLNWRVCARELLAYFRAESVPLSYSIVEVIFSQLFRLPEAPYMELFYGALLIELCRKSSETIPQVLFLATQILYSRVPHMQMVCLERFVNWFSYHMSNFQYRWAWDEWDDALEGDEFSPKQIYVREVVEKCMRFSFHKKMVEVLPSNMESLIPEEPKFKFVVAEPDHPAHEESQLFANKIRNRVLNEDILLSVKRPEEEIQEGECPFDPDLVAIFVGTLLKMANQTFSHTFAALNKYQGALAEFVKYADIMQPVLLRTIYECWGSHRQFVVLMVDKLLKMQIFDPHIIIAWVFSGDLKEEIHRSWVWEIFNIAITRASKQYYVNKSNKENVEKVYMKKKTKFEQENKKASGDSKNDDDDILPKDDEIEVDEEEDYMNDEQKDEIDDRLATLEEDMTKATLEYDRSCDELRNVVLDVCHKFALAITEHLYACDQDKVPYDTLVYRYLIGRFREMLILHWREIFLYWKDINSELLDSSAIDDRIREIFVQFKALKF